jgi:hypothetical protein
MPVNQKGCGLFCCCVPTKLIVSKPQTFPVIANPRVEESIVRCQGKTLFTMTKMLWYCSKSFLKIAPLIARLIP